MLSEFDLNNVPQNFVGGRIMSDFLANLLVRNRKKKLWISKQRNPPSGRRHLNNVL